MSLLDEKNDTVQSLSQSGLGVYIVAFARTGSTNLCHWRTPNPKP